MMPLKRAMSRNTILILLTNKALLNNLRQKHHTVPHKLSSEEARLSEKEITVLKLMCEEKSTREIAETVDLKPANCGSYS